MSLRQIYEGWKNHLLPDEYMKDVIQQVSDERLAICRACPFNSLNAVNYHTIRTDEHCTDCGCSLIPKSKCLSCSCPQDKWGPVVTPEQEKEIDRNDEKEI